MFASRSFAQKFGRNVPWGGRGYTPVKPWRVLFWIIFSTGVGMALIAVLVLVSSFWKVAQVSVEGSMFHSEQEIIEAASIEEGDYMLGFDDGKVAKAVRAACPILESVQVTRQLNGNVTLRVKEVENLYYTCHHTNYYLINGDSMKVLDISSTDSLYREYKAKYLGLPEEANLQVGKKVAFDYLPYAPADKPEELFTYEVETKEPEEEYAYVKVLKEALENSRFAGYLTGIDASREHDLYFVFNGDIMVKLGNIKELDQKLEQAATLATKNLSSAEARAVINVSDLSKSTVRENSQLEMPDWCEN